MICKGRMTFQASGPTQVNLEEGKKQSIHLKMALNTNYLS